MKVKDGKQKPGSSDKVSIHRSDEVGIAKRQSAERGSRRLRPEWRHLATEVSAMKGQRLVGGAGGQRLTAVAVFVLGWTVCCGKYLNAKDKQRPTIDVFTSNYAQVSDRTLEEAEAVATRVLSIAGINTTWHRSGENEGDSKVGQNPSRPEARPGVFLLIIPRTMAAHWALGVADVGFTILPGAGKTGTMAYIFYHRVEELAATGDASASQILGHAIVHEIGHLLLNTPRHSGAGIMQADWQFEQMQLLRRGWLLFTAAQARQLRAAVLERRREVGILQAENKPRVTCRKRGLYGIGQQMPPFSPNAATGSHVKLGLQPLGFESCQESGNQVPQADGSLKELRLTH